MFAIVSKEGRIGITNVSVKGDYDFVFITPTSKKLIKTWKTFRGANNAFERIDKINHAGAQCLVVKRLTNN